MVVSNTKQERQRAMPKMGNNGRVGLPCHFFRRFFWFIMQ